jgi:hypothetical protein
MQMRRTMIQYFTFFMFAMGLAYWASLPQAETVETQALISIASSRVAKLEYVDQAAKTEFAKRPDTQRWWATFQKNPQSSPSQFMTSSKMDELLQKLSPFQVLRVISDVKESELESFGLKDTKKSFSVFEEKVTEPLLTIQIGKQAFGTRNVYVAVKLSEDKAAKVALVNQDLFDDLAQAESHLFERTLTPLVFEEVKSAQVSWQGKELNLDHSKRDDKGQVIWTKAGQSEPLGPMKSWFERLERVRVVKFATEADVKELESIPILFTTKLEGTHGGKSYTESFEFKKVPPKATPAKLAEKGAPPSPPEEKMPQYYVKSTFLGVWSQVASSRLEAVEKDLPAIFAAK